MCLGVFNYAQSALFYFSESAAADSLMARHHIYEQDVEHRKLEREIEPGHPEDQDGGEESECTGVEAQYVGVFHQRLAHRAE